MSDLHSADLPDEVPQLREVPHQLDVLPDGRETLMAGDVERLKELNHSQGDNALGFEGTCGIVSCEDLLRQFGVEVTEGELVMYAALRGLCNIEGTVSDRGGTSVFSQAQLLRDWGVMSLVDVGGSLEGLAAKIEEGRGVIAEMNAGVLWDRPESFGDGSANHAVVVTGVARDPTTGHLQGFYVNDTGEPASGRFVDSRTVYAAWVETGGMTVSTYPLHLAGANAAPAGMDIGYDYYDRWGVWHWSDGTPCYDPSYYG